MSYPIEDVMKGHIYIHDRPEKRERKSMRSHLSAEELAKILAARIRELVPQFTMIDSFRIYGTINNHHTFIDLSASLHRLRYVEDLIGTNHKISFNVEDKEYRRGTEKSKVSSQYEITPVQEFLKTLRREGQGDTDIGKQNPLSKFFDP